MPNQIQFSGVVTEYDIIEALRSANISGDLIPKRYQGNI